MTGLLEQERVLTLYAYVPLSLVMEMEPRTSDYTPSPSGTEPNKVPAAGPCHRTFPS